MINSIRNLLKFRNRKLKISGYVKYKKHKSSHLEIEDQFIFGIPTLGEISRSSLESILILDKDSKLIVKSAAIGRGSRIKLFNAAKIEIGNESYISDEAFICIYKSLKIGNKCAISWNVQIFDNDGHQFMDKTSQDGIIIGNNVWIGCNVTLLKGTVIGDGSVVAAGAVVKGNFPENSLIGGVPAKIIQNNIKWK